MDDVRKLGVPTKTRKQNNSVSNIWCDWARHCLQSICVEEEEKQHPLVEDFCQMTVRDTTVLSLSESCDKLRS